MTKRFNSRPEPHVWSSRVILMVVILACRLYWHPEQDAWMYSLAFARRYGASVPQLNSEHESCINELFSQPVGSFIWVAQPSASFQVHYKVYRYGAAWSGTSMNEAAQLKNACNPGTRLVTVWPQHPAS